ncbi:MAG: Uma2 family endonuclease [Anaerolineae bacterium]|nr:Uma2 family endonuclease [Thermoflexales bacterium]MDW8394994.1 Uma2 family endonuclease [Anaerolineae bacterium]
MPEQATAELVPHVTVPDDERPDLSALAALELPEEDGEPLENQWHYLQAALLRESIAQLWHDRTDYFIGVNMFVFYSLAQARSLDFRGPDLFVVRGVDGTRARKRWVVWEEERRPELVVELLSPRTRKEDLGRKKAIYEQALGVLEYVCYGPDPTEGEVELELHAWQLTSAGYQPVTANEHGWIWSEVLGAWLGLWEGIYGQVRTRWLRLYDQQGRLIPTDAEVAQLERSRAEAERQRAEAAEQRIAELEAELARLRAQLGKTE